MNLEKKTSLKMAKKPPKTSHREHKLIYQHNKLVEARYELTLQEKRVILFCLKKIPESFCTKKEICFPAIEIPVNKFCDLTGIKNNETGYRDLKAVAKRLRSRTLTIEHVGSSDFSIVGWVDRIDYIKKKGVLVINLSRFLMDFLLDLKSNFTAIPLSETFSLSSYYAIRMFEILKQYENIGERKIGVSELRAMLGISEDKLLRYPDLRRKVLEIAQRQLKAKTDIEFDFEEIKTSRKITSLRFVIKKNSLFGQQDGMKSKKKETMLLHKTEQDLKKQILELGFSRPTIAKIFLAYTEKQILDALRVANNQIQKGGVRNPKALFRTALKEGWSVERYLCRL